MKQLFAVITFLFSSLGGNCQWSNIPKDIQLSMIQSCRICAQHPSDSLQVLSLFNSPDNIEACYHNCHVFYKQEQADSAYKYSLYVLKKISATQVDSRFIGATLIQAKILSDKNLFKQALVEFLSLKEVVSDDRIKAYLYTQIGSAYAALDDYTHSLFYLLDAVNNYSIKDQKNLENAYDIIGICYLFQHRTKDAEIYFKRSIAIAEDSKDTLGLAYLYTNIANQYYDRYQDRLALNYFKKALYCALLTKDLSIKETAYRNMAVVSENKKNYHAALLYQKLYEAQHDSSYSRDKVWITAQEKNKLDSELYARKAEVANQASQLQLLELNKQKQQLSLSLFVSSAFLSFFLLAFYAYRQKKKQNIIIAAQREELDALNQTKDQLFSIVAHDLKSPVQTMKMSLNKLRSALMANDLSQANRLSEHIESMSNSTYSLLNNLLYWALSQTGQLYLFHDKLNMKRVTEQVLYDYISLAAAKNIRMENTIAEDVYCKGDMNTIKIILRNLVDNAIKFSSPNTSVIISGVTDRGQCVLSITNTGKSIDDNVIQALTNKNIRHVHHDRSQGQGTGIGLWLVKMMAERNGGSLQIDRKLNGAQIYIYLPEYLNYE